MILISTVCRTSSEFDDSRHSSRHDLYKLGKVRIGYRNRRGGILAMLTNWQLLILPEWMEICLREAHLFACRSVCAYATKHIHTLSNQNIRNTMYVESLLDSGFDDSKHSSRHGLYSLLKCRGGILAYANKLATLNSPRLEGNLSEGSLSVRLSICM
ncbi:hypothetical protein AVEN_83092-1 [Araneus ventricosus]|uniref:Uncharacterized protein n=1 Tax=Araneus ventricosus TaxID=182803 RepID=A0A4Y2AMF0_ARAVE|nr:hypothetical protein AVEN_83092-1 [Araneus ventricosus]